MTTLYRDLRRQAVQTKSKACNHPLLLGNRSFKSVILRPAQAWNYLSNTCLHRVAMPSVENNEGAAGALPSNNSAFFHARMYGEGDYLLVKGLKIKAKTYFTDDLSESFTKGTSRRKHSMKHSKLYSDRANHGILRNFAIRRIVENLGIFFTKDSLLLRDSMKSIPDFAFDLCMDFIESESPLDPEPKIEPSRLGKVPTSRRPRGFVRVH